MSDEAADFVIVGAGSAGCAMADRLSSSGAKIVLLEAGPPDRSVWIHVPAGVKQLLRHPVVNWNYRTTPEPGTNNRVMEWPRGKTLGGSSSINGMMWVRGNRADYDRWAQMGAHGWSYDDVLPYLKSIETYAHGGDEFRGDQGPMRVKRYGTILPMTHAFVDSAVELGFEKNDDLNGRNPAEGVGYTQLSQRGRWRASAARTFLARAIRRPNLKVETNAMATKLVFDGRRCIGVTIRQNGQDRTIRANREVILTAGAINSPHLLQLSGVGPAALLSKIGIGVVHDLPGVGQNLCDHYACRITMRVHGTLTVNQLARGWRIAREAVKYAVTGSGAFSFGASAAQLYVRSRPELAAPDLQYLFAPLSFDPNLFGELEREPGISAAVSLANPESRGELAAKSPDPFEYPALRPNYLSTRNDVQTLLYGLRLLRKIFASRHFAPYVVGETLPGKGVQSDSELEAFARARGASVFHLSGTCRMGTDPRAVVSPLLKVHGLEGLRIADGSVMPTVTTGNTNATCIVIGAKGADAILAEGRA